MKQKCVHLSDEVCERLKKEKEKTGKSQEFLIQAALERMFSGAAEPVPDSTIIALNPDNMKWAREMCLTEGKTLNEIVNDVVEQSRQV